MEWDNLSKKDSKIIREITLRACNEFPDLKYIDIDMDITATHISGCELRLNDLLKADKFNFTHDILGISNHLNRNTGKL